LLALWKVCTAIGLAVVFVVFEDDDGRKNARDQLGGEATVDFLPHGAVYAITCSLEDEG
jgi:hypothetical protein